MRYLCYYPDDALRVTTVSVETDVLLEVLLLAPHPPKTQKTNKQTNKQKQTYKTQ